MHKEWKIEDCIHQLERLGRTFQGPNKEIYMNWTCSGISFRVTGTYLIVELNALPGLEMDRNPLDGAVCHRETWPYAAVFIDEGEEPEHYFEIRGTARQFVLFSGESEETHTITIRKMTENPKGKLSISRIFTDGTIVKADRGNKNLRIEFIGDSITCGFGNLSCEKDRLFYSADENGWLSHAAVAARKLKAEFGIISYSGIAITKGIGTMTWGIPSMAELYPYTDRLIEEHYGKEDFYEEWGFDQSKPDVIVLNLGTNDATVIDFNEDNIRGIQKFEEDYYQFLKMLRDKNGTQPWIICALGSMDYYLYDNILKVAERFAIEQKDTRIRCFKYGRIRMTDGYGACGHPNTKTQIRMGNEIADYISELLQL